MPSIDFKISAVSLKCLPIITPTVNAAVVVLAEFHPDVLVKWAQWLVEVAPP